MIKPLICAIAAMDEGRVIGHKNAIPWDIPEDLAYLRETTKGFPLIMGRSTHESICAMRNIDPRRNGAMPGRFNVVISKQSDYFLGNTPGQFSLATSPKEGLNLAYDFAAHAGLAKIFVFGGQLIYEALLPQVQRLYLTEIDGRHDGDAFFPDFDKSEWTQVSRDQRKGYAFAVYDRV